MEFTTVEFDTRANRVTEWLFTADDLLAAARFLTQHSYHLSPTWGSIEEHFPTFDEWRITPVILMLRAMAVECLLKGIYLKFCGPLAAKGEYIGISGVRDHDLGALARAVSQEQELVLSPPQLDFLGRLSKNLIRGRYPVQKNWAHELLPRAGGDRRGIPLMPPDPDDDLFYSVLRQLRQFLQVEADKLYGDLPDKIRPNA